MDTVEQKPNKVKRFLKETARILRITKRPNRQEYTSMLKITGLGIAIIGLMGFLIFIGKQLLFR